MKKFKNLKEYKAYYRKMNKRSYERMKADPLRFEAYKVKRRAYEKIRRKEMLQELKDQELS